MNKFYLIPLFFLFSIHLFGQNERFFTSEQAIDWVPQLIGYNIEIIGEKNDKEIKATDKERIEFLFITDTQKKAQTFKEAISKKEGYQLYKIYSIEEKWLITGVTEKMSMEFDAFSNWTFEFCKTGFDHDVKLLNWNILDENKAEKVDEFWNWFVEHQSEFYDMNHEKMNEIEVTFKKLDKALHPINESFVYEFSPVLEKGKREFVLSADGRKENFPDLLYLFKRSPELENWEIIPFKQGFDTDPQLSFNNGYKLSWDKVMFDSKETNEGLSINFFIEDYDENNENFGTALVILLDSYLGEYDAVMQIRYVEVFKLNRKKTAGLKEFKELKNVVDAYKKKKRM